MKPGFDPDGVAKNEIDHLGNCPVCGALIECWRTFTIRKLRLAKATSRRASR
jgi:hypothetical protein